MSVIYCVHDIIKEVRSLAKQHNVEVRFKKLSSGIGAEAYYSENLIIIDPEEYSRTEILSKYFHEYVHINCYRKKIWTDYHSDKPNKNKIKKIALKVERFVDRVAEMELYLYDKRIKYIRSYNESDDEIKEFINQYYES